MQPGDFAARELAKDGKIIMNVTAEESAQHIVNFRIVGSPASDTGLVFKR